MRPNLRRRPPRTIRIRGMLGLGDNIMQRPFVRAASERGGRVYLDTPWPELYADLPGVLPVRSKTGLRTQAKNERAAAVQWHTPPASAFLRRLAYGSGAMERMNIYQALEECLPLEGAPFVLDLPPLPVPAIDTGGKPLAVVRPVTERREWLNSARNPRPEYVAELSARIAETHYVVCIADLEDGQEWMLGDLPFCDEALLRGELTTMEALGLVSVADVVIGGVGWILPAALAARRPAFMVLGGQGGHNSPEKLLDDRVDSSRVGWAMPDRYCRCIDKAHNCDREITGLLEQFETWAAAQGVPLC